MHAVVIGEVHKESNGSMLLAFLKEVYNQWNGLLDWNYTGMNYWTEFFFCFYTFLGILIDFTG